MSSSSPPIAPKRLPPQREGDPDIKHPALPPNWNRCHAFLPLKGRFCRAAKCSLLPPPPGSTRVDSTDAIYCGNHFHMYSDTGFDAVGKAADANSRSTPGTCSTRSVASAGAAAKKGRRIPCPIDPSHEIYESRLAKHIKICPAARRKVNDASLPYYRDSVNCGGFGSLLSDEGEDVDESPRLTKKSKSNEDTCIAVTNSCSCITREWAKELALRVLDAYDRLFLDGSNHGTHTPSTKLAPERIKYLSSLTFDQLIEGIPTEDLSQSEFDAGLQLSISAQKIKSGGQRHLRQIGSIVGHLRAMDLLPPLPLKQPQQHDAKEEDNKRNDNEEQQVDTILEMGAGRGMTGLVAAGALAASSGSAKLILVERSGTRGKAETTIRRAIDGRSGHDNNVDERPYMNLAGLNMCRIKCDLAHVHLPTAMDIDSKGSSEESVKNVAVVAKHLCGAGTDLALKSLQPISHHIAGCVMATCCHGVCNWNDYVGRDYLGRVFNHADGSFGRNEFDTLKYWGGMGSAPTVPEHMPSNVQKQQQGEKPEEEGEDKHDKKLVYEDRRTEDRISDVVRDLGLACGSKALGRACQRLIDYGRVEYMKNVLFKDANVDGTRMQHYVNPDVTPQNALLMSKCR